MAEPFVVEIEAKPEILKKEGISAYTFFGNALRSIMKEKKFIDGRRVRDIRHYSRIELKKLDGNKAIYNIYYEPRAKVGNTGFSKTNINS
ncbi:MAG: hypothetical protein ABFD15_07695 [Methanofastidiosum sp.]|jgi:hypothetical protein